MASLERILVPVDFSAGSKAALAYALFLGARLGAAVDVVHVYDTVEDIDPSASITLPGGAPETLARMLQQRADEKLRRFLSDTPGTSGVELRSRSIADGKCAEAIIREARQQGADLVVMGTVGRGGLQRLFLGSIAERVIREAPCPVLTVRVKA